MPLLTRILIIGATVCLACAAGMAWLVINSESREQAEPPLPPLVDIPSFNLIDQRGEPFGSDDLQGKVWIASFTFTRCRGICPKMNASMAQVRDRLQNHPRWADIRLVGFSVDPEHDTPEILSAYGKLWNADPDHWKLLTGEKDTIWTLCEQGFKLPVEDTPEDQAMPILHSDRFVLVDANLQARGYYSGLDKTELELLLLDIETVLNELPRRQGGKE